MKQVKYISQKIWSCLKFCLEPILSIVFSFFSSGLGLWYVLWLGAGSAYLYYHWTESMKFVPFNGNALIFSVWLFMIFRPFIKDVDIPWLKFSFKEFREKQKNVNNAKEEFEKLKNAENANLQIPDGGQND